MVLEPGGKPIGSRKGYMWVYIGDQDDVVFEYTNSRKRDGPETFCQGAADIFRRMRSAGTTGFMPVVA